MAQGFRYTAPMDPSTIDTDPNGQPAPDATPTEPASAPEPSVTTDEAAPAGAAADVVVAPVTAPAESAAPPPARVDDVVRVDEFPMLAAPMKRDSDGAWIFEGVAVSEGVLVYPDGQRELVTPEAVRDTVTGSPTKTITVHHPEGQLVTPDNYARVARGVVESAWLSPDGKSCMVRVVVTSAEGIQAVDDWKRLGMRPGLSVGYRRMVDQNPGVHPIYGHFTASQIGRDVNHIALTPTPRDTTAIVRVDEALMLPKTTAAMIALALLPAEFEKMDDAAKAAADEMAAKRLADLFEEVTEHKAMSSAMPYFDSMGFKPNPGMKMVDACNEALKPYDLRVDSREQGLREIAVASKVASKVRADETAKIRADEAAKPKVDVKPEVVATRADSAGAAAVKPAGPTGEQLAAETVNPSTGRSWTLLTPNPFDRNNKPAAT